MNSRPSSQTLVSVVIPTFNQAEFLKEALDSVISQTHRTWEAIVINNFSTDATVAVVNSLNDARISRLDFANNGVIARSRNKGIEVAKGEYVAFLDSDDLWEPTKLTRSLDALSSGADLVCHAERWFGGGKRERVVQYGPEFRAEYESLLLNGNCISTSATVVRRSVLADLGGFRERDDFITTEDYDLWLRTAKSGYKIVFTREVLGSFRRHSTSASSSTVRHLHAELAVLEEHFRSSTPAIRSRHEERIGLAHYTAARSFTRSSKFLSGFKMFLKSLRCSPWRWRYWAGLVIHISRSPVMILKRVKNGD
jgi:glycosyltransferase involved in cell wall biosynthesis